MLALVAAIDEELTDIRDSMILEGSDESEGLTVYRASHAGKKVLLVKTGMGRHRVLRACKAMLDRFPVTAIVSIGFAGALNPDLKAGELVACSRIASSDPSHTDEYESDAGLLSLAKSCVSPGLRCGTGVTAPRPVSTGNEKRALLAATHADIVDMESYWIGSLCSQNGIPFVTVRAISDSAADSLPQLPSYEPRHTVPYFAMHPVRGFNLYRSVARARENVTAFAGRMIEVAA